MEPSRGPAQKNFKGERLYTTFIPPWRKQSKAVIFWCILLKNHLCSYSKLCSYKKSHYVVYPLLLPLPIPLPASPNLRFSPKSPKPGALSHKSTTGDERGMASWGRCAAAPEPHGLGWELVRSYDFVSWGSLTHSTLSGLPWHWHTHQSSPVAGMPHQA